MLFASARLATTDWVPDLTLAIPVALLGVLLGLALGTSTFGRRGVTWLIVAYTLVVLPWQLSLVIRGASDWLERVASLGGRIRLSLELLGNGRQVDDYVIFLGFVCILFWGLAIFSGYALTRRQDALAALLPGGLAIVVISVYDYYAASRMAYLALYLFLGLALFGRLNFLRSRQEWVARRIYLNPEAATDLSMSIVVSAALVVVIAWNIPLSIAEYRDAAQAWSDASRPLKGIREKLRDAFAPVQQPVPTSRRDYYDSDLALGLGSVHSDAILFSVKVPPETLSLPRFYWRGVAYDTYENGQWESTAPATASFQPEDEFLPLADNTSRLAARYIFSTNMGGQRLLYTPAYPVWVSRASGVQFFPADETSMDVETIRSGKQLAAGESYQARAPVRNPTVAELREAGESYPDWVVEHYLQLPEGFSPRLQGLAEDVAGAGETPYDQAAAITEYLRGQIEYKERIAGLPPDVDPIEWVVLEGRQGFCNYYASAEVLMLRSLGIPARLVAGFSQGEKSETANIYTVRDRNAHAWPEVYFPGIGWVEFEPTGNQDPLLRPLGFTGPGPTGPLPAGPALQPDEPFDPADLEVPQGNPTPTGGIGFGAILLWIIILAAAVVLFLALRRSRRRRPRLAQQASVALRNFLSARNLPVPVWLNNWVRWLEMSPIEQSFHAVNQGLTWLGRPQPVHATPADRAAALGAILPEAGQEIQVLLAEQHAALFSPWPGDVPRAVQAGRRVRYQAVRKRLSLLFSRGKL
jgi:transglutaminase-like putative cysteine protease